MSFTKLFLPFELLTIAIVMSVKELSATEKSCVAYISRQSWSDSLRAKAACASQVHDNL